MTIRPVDSIPLTIPVSPAIQKPKPKEEPLPLDRNPQKAVPAPDFSKTFVPVVDHRMIQPEDFKLPGDSIHEKKVKEQKRKLLVEVEKAARQRNFKAAASAISERV